jgi:hypothetical protein
VLGGAPGGLGDWCVTSAGAFSSAPRSSHCTVGSATGTSKRANEAYELLGVDDLVVGFEPTERSLDRLGEALRLDRWSRA